MIGERTNERWNALNSHEKCELLKETIEQLYSKEGRTKSYIAKTLRINRKTLTDKIAEWHLPEPEPRRHASPKTKKWIGRNKQRLIALLATDVSETDIARQLHVERGFLTRTLPAVDSDIARALETHRKRHHEHADNRSSALMTASSRVYDFEDLDGELWRPMLGHETYEVSNMGRVRRWAKTYDSYYLIQPVLNSVVGHWYVSVKHDGKRRNLKLARTVAFAFCDGHSDERNTVNHKNGDTSDNRAENLEWVSQLENNRHAYRELGRAKVRGNKTPFEKVIYQGRYEFKTVAALARFIGKSETQTRRYLEHPEKHDLEIVPRTN